MDTMTVGNFKANFSEVLERVKMGEEIIISYGKAKRPMAKIVPLPLQRKSLVGCLKGAKIQISDDWKMTPEELLGE